MVHDVSVRGRVFLSAASAGLAIALAGALVVACGATRVPSDAGSPASPIVTTPATDSSSSMPTAPSPSADGSPSGAPRELGAAAAPLPAGDYTSSAFRPRITLTLDDGWSVGTVSSGFLDVQQERGTPDVIAVQFARVESILGSAWSTAAPDSSAAVIRAIRDNSGVTVIGEAGTRVGGLTGSSVVVENRGTVHAPIMRVSAGTLGIDPKRRLQVSVFDTPDGVLAVMVGGSVATWDHTLAVAEPIVGSVVFGP